MFQISVIWVKISYLIENLIILIWKSPAMKYIPSLLKLPAILFYFNN